MAVNQTLMPVPIDLSDEQSLRLFLWSLVEKIDVLLGNRAPELVVSTSQELSDLEELLDTLVTRTNNYTVTDSDFVVLIDATNNPVTITLPSNVNRRYVIKCKEDKKGAYVQSTGLLDGETTPFRLYKHESISVHFDGTNWWII